MSSYYRKSLFRCRAPRCKHENIVWARVDAEENVVEIASAWQYRCSKCGRGSLDLVYQEVFKPK